MLFPGCSFLATLMTFVALTAAFVPFLRAVLRRFSLEPWLRLKRGTIIFPLSPLDAASMRSLAHGRLKAVEEKKRLELLSKTLLAEPQARALFTGT